MTTPVMDRLLPAGATAVVVRLVLLQLFGMGCCGSTEEEAKESDLPPPTAGTGYRVKFKKQGWGDGDYDVHRLDVPEGEDGKPPVWLLMDHVSGGDGENDYKLKYRRAGDSESTVLGSCTLKGIASFDHMIVDGGRQQFLGVDWDDLSVSDGGFDDVIENLVHVETKAVKAQWVFTRRCRIFQDEAMEQQVGYVDATAVGLCYKTWKRITDFEERTDSEGHKHMEQVVREHKTCNVQLKQITYKLDVINTQMTVVCNGVHDNGSFSKATKFQWNAVSSTGAPLFSAISTGEKTSDVVTEPGSEPTSTLISAFIVSICLDPKETRLRATRACEHHVSVWSPPGHTGHIGADSSGAREQNYFAKYASSAHAAGLFDAVAIQPFKREHRAQLTFVADEELVVLATDVVVFTIDAEKLGDKDGNPDLGITTEVRLRGVVVTDVDPDGAAASVDMRVGDRIRRINDVDIEQDASTISAALSGDPIEIEDGKKKRTVAVVVVERDTDGEAVGNAYAESHGDFKWWLARRKADAEVGLVPDTGYLQVLQTQQQSTVPLAVAQGAQPPVAMAVAQPPVAFAQPMGQSMATPMAAEYPVANAVATGPPVVQPVAETAVAVAVAVPDGELHPLERDASSDADEVVEKLRKLKLLKDEGLIDADDYETKKADLLQRM